MTLHETSAPKRDIHKAFGIRRAFRTAVKPGHRKGLLAAHGGHTGRVDGRVPQGVNHFRQWHAALPAN
ncbi:MAG: hypothetical protein IT230_03355 [Flavobacteriales bacterium]|nr:hypothetical protein [Flavobacteriales bacterium]